MRVAICDDEAFHRKQILELLEEYDATILSFEFESGAALLKDKQDFDVIFLDLQMDEINGLATAHELRRRGVESYLIFITSHSEQVFETFKVKAFRFLNKPPVKQDFFEAMDCINEELRDSEKIVINQRNMKVTLPLKDVVMFEAFGDGTYVYDKNGNTYVCSVQLKVWENKLHDKGFFQIHKSYMVSLAYIESVENNKLTLSCIDDELTISRRKTAKFKSEYLDFVRKNARVL